MSILKSLIKTTITYILIVILLNAVFYTSVLLKIKPFYNIFNNYMIIKLPWHQAYVFAHGAYYQNSTVAEHSTVINGEFVSTYDLLSSLHNKGYNYIWVSMCGTATEYILINSTDSIKWMDYVNRNTISNRSFPIFTGFNFIRISE